MYHHQFLFCKPWTHKKQKYCEREDLLIVKTSEDVINTGKAAAYLGEKCILGSDIFLIKHKQNAKFLAYCMSAKEVKDQIKQIVPISTIMHLRKDHLSKIKIPLPPLEVQEAKVNQLDKFRTITEDLEAGIPKLLALTRQQYEYYKEEILKI